MYILCSCVISTWFHWLEPRHQSQITTTRVGIISIRICLICQYMLFCCVFSYQNQPASTWFKTLESHYNFYQTIKFCGLILCRWCGSLSSRVIACRLFAPGHCPNGWLFISWTLLYLAHWGRDKNVRHFADAGFECILLNENIWISLKILLKFVPKVPIDNIPALVQIMAWHRSGDKPLSEPMMVSLLTQINFTRPQWVKPISKFLPDN